MSAFDLQTTTTSWRRVAKSDKNVKCYSGVSTLSRQIAVFNRLSTYEEIIESPDQKEAEQERGRGFSELNHKTRTKKNVPCFGGKDTGLYSNLRPSHDGAGESKCSSDDGMGLLILEGEDIECKEIKSGKIPEPASFSIPGTVFLPIDIGSVAVVSCVTQEDEKNEVKESKEVNQIADGLDKRNQLSSAVPPCRRTGIFYRLGQLRSYISRRVAAFRLCSFNIVQFFPVLCCLRHCYLLHHGDHTFGKTRPSV